MSDSTDVALRSSLEEGIRRLSLTLSDHQTGLLLDYLALIRKWTRVYNLTAVRDPAEMLTHHLLDSLAVILPLRRQTGGQAVKLLDVGAGAGLPGVVIAICCPEISVTCVDTVAKKAAFIQQVAVTLKLPNLRALHARVETLTDGYDVVASRAFASLADFVTWSRAALREGGGWMAMKGRAPDAEVEVLPAWATVASVEALSVPGLNEERCLVWLKMGEAA
jgi:16S rRNA (guanine527-N7)-methyltransferase